jgi:hypothetical protein
MKKTKLLSLSLALLSICAVFSSFIEGEEGPGGKKYACKLVVEGPGGNLSYSCAGTGTYCSNAFDCM